MDNLENVIDQAVTESTNDVSELDNVADETVDEGLEVSAESTTEGVVEDGNEVDSPAEKGQEVKTSEEDEFLTKMGVQSKSFTGRDNPIPYSRVRKIVAKAKAEAKEQAIKEFESKYGTEKLQPLEAKVKEYEGYLTQVAQFEQLLENDPVKFLQRLSQMPAYGEFFNYVRELEGKVGGKADPKQEQTPQTDPNDPMPQPNKVNSDGSRVYDLDGLNELMAWQSRQVEKRVLTQAEERLGKRIQPFEQEYQRQQYYQQASQVVDSQLAEARKWDRFEELEPTITGILEADKERKISLERAYMMAYQQEVVPKLMADRNKMRTEVLADIKKRPVTTSAPVNASQPKTSPEGGQSIEDIILAEMRKLQA